MSPLLAVALAILLADAIVLGAIRRHSVRLRLLRRSLNGATSTKHFTSDPSRVGDETSLRVHYAQLVGRFGRHGDPFCLALIEVAIAKDPSAPLPTELAQHAASVLLESARTEDTVCQIDHRTFVVLLTTTDVDGALRFADRARGRLSSAPARTAAGQTYLIMVAGVVEWEKAFVDLDGSMRQARKQLDFQKRSIASQRTALVAEMSSAASVGQGYRRPAWRELPK